MAGNARKKSTGGNKKRNNKQKKNLRHEFQGILLIAVGVILLACLIMGDSAVVPRYINMALLGCFGLLAYIIPVLFAIFGVFRIILKKITVHKGNYSFCVKPYRLYSLPVCSAIYRAGLFSGAGQMLSGRCCPQRQYGPFYRNIYISAYSVFGPSAYHDSYACRRSRYSYSAF